MRNQEKINKAEAMWQFTNVVISVTWQGDILEAQMIKCVCNKQEYKTRMSIPIIREYVWENRCLRRLYVRKKKKKRRKVRWKKGRKKDSEGGRVWKIEKYFRKRLKMYIVYCEDVYSVLWNGKWLFVTQSIFQGIAQEVLLKILTRMRSWVVCYTVWGS